MLTDADLMAFAATTDLARSHAFYGGVLGLRHVETTAFANVYDARGTMLRVTRVDRVAGAPYTVLGWRVSDVHAEIAALTAAGVDFARFERLEQDPAGVWTSPDGGQIAWFRDPDANVLSVAQLPRPVDTGR